MPKSAKFVIFLVFILSLVFLSFTYYKEVIQVQHEAATSDAVSSRNNKKLYEVAYGNYPDINKIRKVSPKIHRVDRALLLETVSEGQNIGTAAEVLSEEEFEVAVKTLITYGALGVKQDEKIAIMSRQKNFTEDTYEYTDSGTYYSYDDLSQTTKESQIEFKFEYVKETREIFVTTTIK